MKLLVKKMMKEIMIKKNMQSDAQRDLASCSKYKNS